MMAGYGWRLGYTGFSVLGQHSGARISDAVMHNGKHIDFTSQDTHPRVTLFSLVLHWTIYIVEMITSEIQSSGLGFSYHAAVQFLS